MTQPASIFFGYPSRPDLLRETLSAASAQIARMAQVACNTWEQLHVSGRLIIHEILAAIDGADVAIFEVTTLNENVMFELGYAIGSGSTIWLLRDPSFAEAENDWRKMRTLTTVGYTAYTNSDQIRIAFLKERPHIKPTVLFDDLIAPVLQPETLPGIFYVRGQYDTNAERALTRRVHTEERAGVRVVEADPQESAIQPLTWYAQQIYASGAVIVHFDDPQRVGSDIYNARNALVAGLAVGMRRPLLMLAQEAYTSPIDYRELLFAYRTADLCVSHTDQWLTRTLEPVYERIRESERRESRLRLATELKSLTIGEHVAENEIDTLHEYFIRTAPYEQVLANRTAVFLGRKGAGKSANALEAVAELSEDRRQLVCLIKPYGYELNAVVALLDRYRERDEKGFVVESLWKFLLYTEIALAAYRDIQNRPYGVPADSAEAALVSFLDDAEFVTMDFAVRLERTIDDLVGIPSSTSIEKQRTAISERLHSNVLGKLRRLLVRALRDKVRVAVIIDNLDRAWERGPRTAHLAEFLLSLITVAEQIDGEVRRESSTREPLRVTLAIFLRSDIFSQIAAVAPEPDKIPVARVEWRDPELLLRVIEERYSAARGGGALPDELWQRYFCETVRGIDTRTYITWRILPRPRDIVYLVNAAITVAINRRHPRIEEADVLRAEELYSQFALEVLDVESGDRIGRFGDILYEFAGTHSVVDRAELEELLRRGGVEELDTAAAIDHLRSLSFLAPEVDSDRFEFAEDPRDLEKIDALAARWAEGRGDEPLRYVVHPAFRPYLEIDDVAMPPGQLILNS